MPCISVIQPGARLHYAVPEILARAGLLKRLYTDLHAEHSWLRALERALPTNRQPKPLRRLLGRRLPADLPTSLVEDFAFETMLRYSADRVRIAAYGTGGLARRLLARVEAAVLGPDDVIYTVLVNEDVETMRRLKSRGVKIVHECMIGPDVGLWVQEERRLFPGIESEDDPAAIEAGRARDKEKYALADLVLVPSDFVRRAVLHLGCEPHKIELVPYGLAVERFSGQPDPQPGRVLFVGSVGLRKGAHYLAAASRILAKQGLDVEIRVVGPVQDSVKCSPVFEGPRYIGQTPRSLVQAEYLRADVFVMPTICDSFALVHLEAMAAGLPVITTPNCGSVVRDGVDGFVVPIRDPAAIAKCIERLVSNRSLRAEMSANARDRAQEFSLKRYGERLLAALGSVLAA
jgi:glycosyltransferase involved in cell wall biosynthesis